MPQPAKRSILRRTIRISNTEGVLSQVYNAAAGPGSIFNTKFAIMLGAQPIHFGLLVAIGQLSQVFQLLGVAITRNLTTRKEVVVKLISLGRILTFLMGFIPFLLPAPASMLAFLLLFFTSSALQAIGSNAWVAWISDIVPNCMRGRFFSIRTQYLFVAGLAAGFLLSAFVDLFDPSATTLAKLALPFLSTMAFFSPQNLVYAFPIVFIIGGLMGLLAMKVLSRQPEKPKAMERETFRELVLIPLKDKNFRRLLLFGLWFMVAVGVGSPFWQPFMIQTLGMSLVDMQIYGTISTLAAIMTLRLWGKMIDHVGNRTAMVFALVLGGINPLIWVFATRDLHWFVYCEGFTSGIMWSGAGVIATNFVLAIAPPEKRQVYSGMLGAINGLGIMCTSLLSGAWLPPPTQVAGLNLAPEQVEFAISGFLRWSSVIPLLWVVEPRQKSVGEALHIMFDFTKVRVGNLYDWVRGRRRIVAANGEANGADPADDSHPPDLP
jgi:MFS family permease